MKKTLYICDVRNPSEHCKEHCFHGIPHVNSRILTENCVKLEELCDLSNSKRRVRVKCRKLTKREMMQAQAMKDFSIGQGVCCCHTSCINMQGPILTGSVNVLTNKFGNARLDDVVIGNCGHTGIIISSSSTVNTTSKGNARIGDSFSGCFSGTIISGSPNVNIGG